MKLKKLKSELTEILNLEGVDAIFVISEKGEVLIDLSTPKNKDLNPIPLLSIVKALDNMKEAELIFESKRLWIKNIENNYLVLIANPHTSMAALRLRCDALFST